MPKKNPTGDPVDLVVWGEYACFTRPEFKVERVTYPVITPAAARGVLEAIYWKPQFRYQIREIGVIAAGSQLSLLRNEIKSTQKSPPKKACAADASLIAEDDRAQRTSLVLRDVRYRIRARIDLRNGETNIGKHLDGFRRRAARGAYFHHPYLGTREFPADFEPFDQEDPEHRPDESLNLSVGPMLFDTAYVENPQWYADHSEDRLEFWEHDGDVPRQARGLTKRLFADAEVQAGQLKFFEPPEATDDRPRQREATFSDLYRRLDKMGA